MIKGMESSKPTLRSLDAFKKPPEGLRLLFKRLQKSSTHTLETDADIIDLNASDIDDSRSIHKLPSLKAEVIRPIFDRFIAESEIVEPLRTIGQTTVKDCPVLEATGVPGGILLVRYLTGQADSDRSNEDRRSKASFFSMSPETVFVPKDRKIHKNLNLRSALNKKLRWVTLGGQYDWTAKEYPDQPPPAFPADIHEFLRSLFPDTISEAAIVNLYSPGDMLSLHRDVAEQSDRGLISISIGCDGLFLVGVDSEDGTKSVTVKLRSGDVVYMTNQARSAWHGVPKILAETCPEWLKWWPMFEEYSNFPDCWQGWMSTKRINVNVRQMHAD